jgi:hypothetical protein
MSSFAANLVWLLHVLIVIAAVTVPFSDDDTMLAAYVFMIPFLWMHWLMNDDTCALTALECRLRGLESSGESFIYKVVSPVYKIKNAQVKSLAWWGSVALWALAVYRVRQRGSLGIAWKQAFRG